MTSSWLSLLPPIFVLISACITKNLNRSLLIGIICAACIAQQGAPLASLITIYDHFIAQIFDPSRLYLYLFLISISILIALFNRTGSAIAFARAVTSKLKNKKMVEISTVGLLTALFIDDYLNLLTVGYVMRPITDKFAIPRAKLAFFIHSLAGPLVILAPISSWVAVITTQLSLAGISPTITSSTTIIGEPFMIYLQTIPFIFYSLILIGSLYFVIFRPISYGLMHQHEQIALTTGNLNGGKHAPHETALNITAPNGSALDLIVPLVLLVVSVIVGILYAGEYHLLGGTRSLLEAAKHNTKTELILALSGLLATFIAFIFVLMRRTLTISQIPSILLEGLRSITSTLILVTYATTLGAFLSDDLHTGAYLATTFLQFAPLALLPLLFFATAVLISMMTGSAWGTIIILTPIGVQMLLSLLTLTPPIDISTIPLLFPVLGAIFSGAVCGNHLSPLAETTLMAATSAASYPIDHIQTQLPYALPVLFSTSLAFLSAGFFITFGITTTILGSLLIGLSTCLLILELLNRKKKNS